MEEIVRAWLFENEISTQIIRTLQENEIDEKSISKLTPNLIKELFPKIGLRIKFLEKWSAAYGARGQTTIEESEIDSDDSDGRKTPPDVDEKNEYSLKRCDAFSGKTSYDLRIKKIDIKAILNKTIQGQGILTSFKKTRNLTRKHRNVIVDLILSDILSGIPRLTNEDFDYLATAIVKVFRNESTATYYIPPIPKRFSRSDKSIVARGKLVDKYRNKIREFRTLTGCNALLDKPSCSSTNEPDDEDEVAIRESALWLAKHTEPWEVVVAKWKQTADFRRRDNDAKAESKVYEIFERWPILKHPKGCDLIEEDFAFLKLTTVQLDVNIWSTFYAKISNVRPFRKDDSNAEALNALLQTDNLSDDCRTVLQLLLLPHIVPPKGRLKIGKRQWKPTISECKDSMIMHAVLPADTIKIQEDRYETMKNLGVTLQPFIVAVGPTLAGVSSFYVCIDKVLYKVPSAIKALDICFKCFHALDIEYPPGSEHLWLLVQKSVYKFTTKWDKITPYVMETLTEISNLDKENDDKNTE